MVINNLKNVCMRYLLLILFVQLIASCSKDEPIPEPTIVGLWTIDSEVVNSVPYPYEHEACGKDQVEFKDDKTYRLIEVNNCQETVYRGTFITEGNTIRITVDQEATVGTFGVTQDSLSISQVYDWDGDEFDDIIVTKFYRN